MNEKPAKPCRETLVLQSGNPAGKAFRQDQWVLLSPPPNKKGVALEFYNLADDPAQKKNLAAAKPEKVKELAELLKQAVEKPGDSGRKLIREDYS